MYQINPLYLSWLVSLKCSQPFVTFEDLLSFKRMFTFLPTSPNGVYSIIYLILTKLD